MTLPRFRVRELLFLVVYAALIGQAFVLSFVDPGLPSRYLPSNVSGYVWVPAPEAMGFSGFQLQKGTNGGQNLVSSGQAGMIQSRDLKPDVPRVMGNSQGELFMLVAEELVK